MFVVKQSAKAHGPLVYVFGVTRSGIEPRPPAPRADALTTVLRRGGPKHVGSQILPARHVTEVNLAWQWFQKIHCIHMLEKSIPELSEVKRVINSTTVRQRIATEHLI